MDIISWDFLTLIILVFSIVMILAGVFSTYFGKGKNRAFGVLIIVIGLAVGLFWVYLINWSGISPFNATRRNELPKREWTHFDFNITSCQVCRKFP